MGGRPTTAVELKQPMPAAASNAQGRRAAPGGTLTETAGVFGRRHNNVSRQGGVVGDGDDGGRAGPAGQGRKGAGAGAAMSAARRAAQCRARRPPCLPSMPARNSHGGGCRAAGGGASTDAVLGGGRAPAGAAVVAALVLRARNLEVAGAEWQAGRAAGSGQGGRLATAGGKALPCCLPCSLSPAHPAVASEEAGAGIGGALAPAAAVVGAVVAQVLRRAGWGGGWVGGGSGGRLLRTARPQVHQPCPPTHFPHFPC